ncbi:hypothetical protein BW731_03400 [Vagococcus martis]|uniref:CYTH domain-containing protein n=1 Tax=Vagococcus martis TaxID=1768210 RepID=A0A1V4DFR0_9ENTE|nr:CYTH domain-containing protein [Vagococcus martis]OPF87322.1 hypothetical protein BW731_03400 [Vagococcus martis]
MAKEIEIEFKNMLTKDEFQQLLTTYFPDTPAFSQTNCYFDTPDNTLKEKSMGLRLRKRQGKNECTLKVPTSNTNAYQEITDSLTEKEINTLIKEERVPLGRDVANYLESIGVAVTDLKKIGFLTTYRREKKLNNECLLVLDESHFGKTVDYELEMEVTESKKGELFFNDFLIKENIKRHPASKKIARMIEYQS